MDKTPDLWLNSPSTFRQCLVTLTSRAGLESDGKDTEYPWGPVASLQGEGIDQLKMAFEKKLVTVKHCTSSAVYFACLLLSGEY